MQAFLENALVGCFPVPTLIGLSGASTVKKRIVWRRLIALLVVGLVLSGDAISFRFVWFGYTCPLFR